MTTKLLQRAWADLMATVLPVNGGKHEIKIETAPDILASNFESRPKLAAPKYGLSDRHKILNHERGWIERNSGMRDSETSVFGDDGPTIRVLKQSN